MKPIKFCGSKTPKPLIQRFLSAAPGWFFFCQFCSAKQAKTRGKPRFCPHFIAFPVCLGFPRKINSPPLGINQVLHAGRPVRPSTVRSDEWPAWFSFWFSGCWRALAKGTAWAGFSPPVLKKRAKRSERSGTGTGGRLSRKTGVRHQCGQYRVQNYCGCSFLYLANL